MTGTPSPTDTPIATLAPTPTQTAAATQEASPTAATGTGISGIATGYYHTCALTSADGVACWGSNDNGQLGDGTTDSSLTPVAVSGLDNGVQAIAAGVAHSCALTSAGAVECWGWNVSGQLGDGTNSDSSTPVAVSGLSGDVIAIAANTQYTCALTSAGGVECWGFNLRGQLGDGTTDDSWTPVAVSGLATGVTAISAGDYHACALTTTGEVKCWGADEGGQLGDGASDDSSTPVPVAGLDSATAVSAGYQHTCALSSEGGVECWGYNTFGSLGDGTSDDSLTPVLVSGLGGNVTAISAGDYHTCALTSAGGAECWGANDYGQLGDGTQESVSTPVAVSGLASEVTAVSAGYQYTCALTNVDPVMCWGNNDYGQLGDGTQESVSTPVAVSGL